MQAVATSSPDVLVLGEHPSSYLAAAMLRARPSPLTVVHATLPDAGPAWADRLVLVNPDLFQLHRSLAPLRRRLEMTPIYGLRFLGEEQISSQHRSKSAMGLVARYGDIRDAAAQIARQSGATLIQPASLSIIHVDETGLDVELDKQRIRAKALVVGNAPPPPAAGLLGLDQGGDRQAMHRCFLAPLCGDAQIDLGARPLVPMSLDLQQMLRWGWLLEHRGAVQISVIQALADPPRGTPRQWLEDWLRVLRQHGVIGEGARLDLKGMIGFDLPLAGALEHEGVANRTLLIGPAGGFYSACAEDIYPNCWSAVFAVDVIRRALRETHLQDALDAYRHKWRTSLGDYLRGPQQNLRFLLPMVYRNQNLTSRMAEAILLGKSMVR